MKRHLWLLSSVTMLALSVAAGCAHHRQDCDTCGECGCGEGCDVSTGTHLHQTAPMNTASMETPVVEKAEPLAAIPNAPVTPTPPSDSAIR